MTGVAILDRQRLGDHWCVPYPGTAQQRTNVASIARQGLREGQQVILIVEGDPDLTRRHLSVGVPAAERAMASGQLCVRDAKQWYLGRPFEPRQLVEQLADAVDAAERAGYQGLRAMGDLTVLDGHLPAESLIEYETLLGPLYATYPVIGTCVHDPGRLAPQDWEELVSVHPCTIGPTGTDLISAFRPRIGPCGIQLTGEIDVVNRGVLQVLLAGAAHQAGCYDIDATELRFADVNALGCLLDAAASRSGRATIIRCGFVLAKALRALGADTIEGLVLSAETRS